MNRNFINQKLIYFAQFSIIIALTYLPQSEGVYSLEEYCNKFSELFKPYACRVANFPPTTTTTPRPWNATTTEEWWEEDCSCELNCTANQNSSEERKRRSLSDQSDYECQSCGSDCPVDTRSAARCTCAVLGRSKKGRCRCTANCASFRYQYPFAMDYDNDTTSTSCIFNVKRLDNGVFSDSNAVDHTCECTKSKSAENNTMPDFICICQPSH